MIVRLCDECNSLTHACVEIQLEDANVQMRDPDTGKMTKGRVREMKRRGSIKRRVWEIDLCPKHWPDLNIYPPFIPGNPTNVVIEWNLESSDSPS